MLTQAGPDSAAPQPQSELWLASERFLQQALSCASHPDQDSRLKQGI